MKKIFRVLLLCIMIVVMPGWLQPAQASPADYTVENGAIKIAPVVHSSLDNMQPGDMMTVIITLRQQADLSRVAGADRGARQQGVIRALQANANATQGHLTGLLKTREAQGLVQSFDPFWVFNGFSVTATSGVIDELARQPEVLSIAVDAIDVVPVTSSPEPNLSAIAAPDLWAQGITGQGVVVASMDSGVDINHPELKARWRDGSNSWFDPYNEHATPADLTGHGTWTMGVMLAGDAGGSSIGVAPGAQWIAVKIFNDHGKSTSTAVHQGFQWLLDPDGNPSTADAPQVVNNSWTYSSPGCHLDFEPDLEALRAAGILPIFAAGNGGPYSNTSYSPANNPAAFAVGATDNGDQIYAYSSRGPNACSGSTGPFPELVAPGVNIRTTDLWGGYTYETGTSMAAPHVSGGLALLLSAYPNLSAADQESALINSAIDLGLAGPDDVYGYGRLNLLAALDWLASAPPPPPPASTVHVGDLDGSNSTSRSKWNAIVTVLVHDNYEAPVSGATVYGSWSNGASGTGSCVTDANGLCQIEKSGLNANKAASVAFSVTDVTQANLTYQPTANHDPDPDSDGTTIIIAAP